MKKFKVKLINKGRYCCSRSMTSLSTVMVPRVRWKKAVSSSCLSMAVTGSSVSSSLLSRTLLLVLAAWCRELQYSCSISPVWSCSTSICSCRGRLRLLVTRGRPWPRPPARRRPAPPRAG